MSTSSSALQFARLQSSGSTALRFGRLRPREIIDRAEVQEQIAAVFACASSPLRARDEILAVLKNVLAGGREKLRKGFEEDGASGLETAHGLSFLTDQMIRLIYDHVLKDLYPISNPSTSERLALVAVGGYGRGELAPQSDVDLLFPFPYKLTPHGEQVVESLLYFLWDLGFKVGHATRSVDDAMRMARQDDTIATNMLEMRFLWGDQSLYLELKARYHREVQIGSASHFIEAKLAERDLRHKRFGEGSRYSLEPNIKESKGGLRDLHTLQWLVRYVFNVRDITELVKQGVLTRREVKTFNKALNYFWTLRCHMHYISERGEERLTFDLQQRIAPRMGYTAHAGTRAVERLMKHYFLVAKDVGALTRIVCAQLEVEHNRRSRFRMPLILRQRRLDGFPLEGDRLMLESVEALRKQPLDLLRIFQVAQEHGFDIHPQALRWISQNLVLVKRHLRDTKEAGQLFVDMLTKAPDPETTLRRLNEAGILGRLLPDFGRVVSQMQFNMYHHYTVDEHTIRAIGVLYDIEQGKLVQEAPVVSEVVHKVLSRRVLYIAVLLHDIAKGRKGDHSVNGAKIAEKLCPKLGFTAEETESVAWLVRWHLMISDTAFCRDLDDPQTLRDLCDEVQSVERLRLLLVLTVADIRAVGPNTWNAWKASLLRDIYWRAEEMLSGGFITEGREVRVRSAQERMQTRLEQEGWTPEDIKVHIHRGYDSYWLSLDHETHLRHARLIQAAEAEGRELSVDTRIDSYRQVTEVTIYSPDHPGLMNRIAGALAVAGATVEGARIFTLSNGMALDIFYVHDVSGGNFERQDKLDALEGTIHQTLHGNLQPLQELQRQSSSIPSRLDVFTVTPRVLIDNKASRRHTVVEVNGLDRPGLLYRLTFAIANQNLIIDSAQITTYGERAVDTFYVHDALGSKVLEEGRLQRLREVLLAALERSSS